MSSGGERAHPRPSMAKTVKKHAFSHLRGAGEHDRIKSISGYRGSRRMKESTSRIFHWEPDFSRKMLRIALPIALQNLVAASAQVVDGLMVETLGNEYYAAVTQAGRYSFLFQLFLFGAASGTSMFISQFWGKRDVGGIHKVMSLCLRITLGLALLFFLGAALIPRQIMSLFLQEGLSREQAVQYLSTVGFSYLFAGVNIVFANTLRATGRATLAMTAGITSILVNTLFNYILIHGRFGAPPMGVRGAAVATVIAEGVSMVINVGYTYWKRQPGAIKIRHMKWPERQFTLDYIRRVLPVVLNEGLWCLGMTMYAVFHGMLGDDAVNAVGVYSSLDELMTVAVFGVVNASSILIGHAIGAGRRDEAVLTAWRMLLVVECMSLVTAGGIIALRYPMLSLFRHLSAGSLESAAHLLVIACCVMPARFFNTINIVGILRAGGDTVFSMALDAGTVWLVGVPCTAVATMALGWPIEGVFAATMVEEVVKLMAGLPRFLSGKWINNLTTIGKREEQT